MLLLTLALPVILLQNAQAQTSSRLVAAAHKVSNGVTFAPSDSSVYHYSNGRSGSIDFSINSFDAVTYTNMQPLGYDNTTEYGFIGDSAYNNFYVIQTFDANNNVSTSVTQIWNNVTLSYDLYSKTLYTYNASNMITSSILQYWNGTAWYPYSQRVYTYNASGKVYIDMLNIWDNLTSAFDPYQQSTYYYDANMNQINEIDQQWNSGSPQYTQEYVRTYSSTNQLLTNTYSSWNGTAWVPSTMYTHAYDTASNPISLLFQTYNTGTAAWENNALYLYSNFNGSHLPMNVVRQTWNNAGSGMWVNAAMTMYAYNTHNQVTNATTMSWNITGLYEFENGDPVDNYYYETATTAVNNVANNGGEVNIYPVPAQNMLHIDLNWSVAQSATISIMDMTGHVVRQWNAPAGTQYNSAVSLNNLASGNYLVKINGEKGQIVKQIVVAH